MRVLVVSHGHPAFSIGGAEVASHALFRALDATPGIEAHYLARAAPPLQRHAGTPLLSLRQGPRETFLHVADYDHDWLASRALHDLSGPLADWLRQLAPDVVHIHHLLGFGVELLALLRAVLPRAALVITFHEYLAICAHHGQMVKTGGQHRLCHAASPAECAGCYPERGVLAFHRRERFLKDHLLLADAFVSPSHFLARRHVAWGLPAPLMHVIENGVAARVVAPPRPVAPGGRRARFGFFGQVTEFKGIGVLLDAVSRIPDAAWGDDAALCLFGGNLEFQPTAFRERFAALLARTGNRVRFHGAYRSEEMPRLMAQVDWVMMPSIWWENAPVVIQEAFLHRRPVICSDIGGMAEKVRDGMDGLHFRAGSPEDLAQLMMRAADDTALWQRLSDGCVAPPDLPATAAAHVALYRPLVSARSRQRLPALAIGS